MVVMVWDMGYCGKCGTPNLATVVFCQQCGTANTPPSNTSNAGRPVISMDPRKKGQMSENASGPAVSVPQYQVMPQQISNIAPAQFQSSPITPHVAVSSSNTTKIAIAVVGIIVAIIAIIFLAGRKDSNSPAVAPSNQQSGSSSSQTSDEAVEEYYEEYPSYDDYPSDFRSAYIDSCTEEGNYEYCLCSLENMESIYNIDEITTFIDSGSDLTWLYEEIASGCY